MLKELLYGAFFVSTIIHACLWIRTQGDFHVMRRISNVGPRFANFNAFYDATNL